MIHIKKIIIVLFVITVFLLLTDNKSKTITIPKNAIRFRIIANSNEFKDQSKKMEIKKDLEPIIANVLKNANNKTNTKELINANMSSIRSEIEKHKVNYNINYGMNYFPEKIYKGVTYPEGNYESLVITLGDGLGENWWCVLFPPLCLLEAQENDYDEYTYSFYMKDIIDKYTS